LGIEGITPKCEIAIISSDKFHDLSSTISSENLQLLEQIGSKDLEKLCSIQEYIPHTKDFLTLMCEYLKKGDSLGILDVLDNDNIEDLNLLLWASYDNDAHPGNFLVTEIVDPHTQKVTIKLIKVDNAMSFPEHNIGFDNFLFTFDVKRDSISDRLRKKISSFKEENIANLMKDLKFSKSSIESFIERISILKELSRRESISLFEINLRFALLGRSNGKDLALSDYSIPELEAILGSDHLLDTTSRISL